MQIFQVMSRCSPIQEYYKCIYGRRLDPDNEDVTNDEIHELLVRMRNEQYQHLREQDLLLGIIRNQSRPQFGIEVLANLVGSALWDGILFVGGKLLKP